MVAIDHPVRKQALLSRALQLRIKRPAPRAVVSWVQEHLRLPEADMRRMKKLYDKVMSETATPKERAELDSLLEACAAMDLLRARVLTGELPERKSRRA